MSTAISSVDGFVGAGLQLMITRHARERARERLHWSASTIVRMAQRALECGLAPGNAAGHLRFFLFGKENAAGHSCPFLYGENIYVFTIDVAGGRIALLTIYRAPNELLRSLVNKPSRVGIDVVHGHN